MTKNQKKWLELGLAGCLFGIIMFIPSHILLWILCIPGAIALWCGCLIFSWYVVSEIDMRMDDESD